MRARADVLPTSTSHFLILTTNSINEGSPGTRCHCAFVSESDNEDGKEKEDTLLEFPRAQQVKSDETKYRDAQPK